VLRLLLSRKGEVCSHEFRLLSVLFLNLVSALFRFWFRCFGCLFGRSCRGLFFFFYYRCVVLNLLALLVFLFLVTVHLPGLISIGADTSVSVQIFRRLISRGG